MQQEDRKGAPKRTVSANKATVRVFANKVGNNVVFTHDWTANRGPTQDPPIDLPHKSGSWDIDLQLHDFTGLGLEFESNIPEEVMWVRKGKSCPTKKGNGGHVNFKTVARKGRTSSGPLDLLQISNDNKGAACDLHFMLRFKAGRKKYKYDPIIRNRGTN